MADVNAWGWQGSSRTIKDRTTYMLDHSPIPFNVVFKVRRPGEESVVIKAHKDVLAMGSEVFLAMFYGGLTENNKIINVLDTDPRAFQLMIRFLYTDDLSTELLKRDAAVAFEVMRCAGKYGVPYLYIQCRQWIVEHFVGHFESRKNVKARALPCLQLALKAEYEDEKILEAIWNVIDVCAESVLQTSDEVLRDVSLDVLTLFLARDSLTLLKEKHLYDFMIRWAQLRTSESEATELTLRQRLGDAIKNIRYTQMDLSEFSNGPAADNVLTLEETVLVYRHQFVPVVEGQFPFVSRPREKTAPPTMLTIDTAFFHGKSDLSSICLTEHIAEFTIQIAKLHPLLTDLVDELDSPRSNNVSTATWSLIENSILTAFTVRFGHSFTNDSGQECNSDLGEQQQLLLKQNVKVELGFGDVAMEVAYRERVRSNGTKNYRLKSLSLIFGGYSSSTYRATTRSNRVFYLGRIVSGTTDFSFLRRFIEPGNFLPASESMIISTKFSGSDGQDGEEDDDNAGEDDDGEEDNDNAEDDDNAEEDDDGEEDDDNAEEDDDEEEDDDMVEEEEEGDDDEEEEEVDGEDGEEGEEVDGDDGEEGEGRRCGRGGAR